MASIDGARESARRSRETVSTELWEAINTTWLSMHSGGLQRLRPRAAFKLVRERCAVITGIADGTMSHDQGWQFMTLGRSLERVDMTARMITSATITATSDRAWTTTLRACGAHHAFTRYYQGANSDRDAAEFLLLDRLFPRSIIHTLGVTEEALANLDVGERRAGLSGEASRILGRARAELQFRPLEHILADLPETMTELQRVCAQASTAITARYFEGAAAMEWHGGGW